MATRRPKVPRADALGRPSGPAKSAGQLSAGHQGAGNNDAGQGSERTAAASGRPATKTAPPSASGAAERRPGAPRVPVRPKSTAGAASTPGKASKPGQAATLGKSDKMKAADSGKAKPAGAVREETPENDPVPAKAFSGRVLALAVVMIAITIMLAPTVRIFLEKRSEISALEAEISSKQAEQADLNKQLSRWQDPNYVKQQARDRINMVMPGETGYWVFGGDEAAGTPGGRTGSGTSENPANLPWVDALWESIKRSATD